MEEMSDVISEGQFVIVQRGDQQRVVLFQAHQTITYGKGPTQQDIQLKNALGQEFYSSFKVVSFSDEKGNQSTPKNKGKPAKKQYCLEKSAELAAVSLNELKDLATSLPSGKDNRNIIDDKTSQQLGHSDIVCLREQGVPSRDILDSLILNSKTFSQKTEFSQEKYLKKKEKTYGDVVMFLKIDVPVLAEYYFQKDPMKVLGLRPDTVSQILSYSNTHAGGRYLVYENASGLLVAAMLQRMGGHGLLLHCHPGTNPQKQALMYMNFSAKTLDPLKSLDVFYLIWGKIANSASSEVISADQIEAVELEEPVPKRLKTSIANDNTIQEKDAGSQVSIKIKSSTNREENEKSLDLLHSSGFDGLIICGREHPLSTLQRLLRHLSPSSPFVVFCSFSEPLMECYMWIKEKGYGVNLHIVDNWFRNIQVESERTHPEINMSSSGGYLLYGIFVTED